MDENSEEIINARELFDSTPVNGTSTNDDRYSDRDRPAPPFLPSHPIDEVEGSSESARRSRTSSPAAPAMNGSNRPSPSKSPVRSIRNGTDDAPISPNPNAQPSDLQPPPISDTPSTSDAPFDPVQDSPPQQDDEESLVDEEVTQSSSSSSYSPAPPLYDPTASTDFQSTSSFGQPINPTPSDLLYDPENATMAVQSTGNTAFDEIQNGNSGSENQEITGDTSPEDDRRSEQQDPNTIYTSPAPEPQNHMSREAREALQQFLYWDGGIEGCQKELEEVAMEVLKKKKELSTLEVAINQKKAELDEAKGEFDNFKMRIQNVTTAQEVLTVLGLPGGVVALRRISKIELELSELMKCYENLKEVTDRFIEEKEDRIRLLKSTIERQTMTRRAWANRIQFDDMMFICNKMGINQMLEEAPEYEDQEIHGEEMEDVQMEDPTWDGGAVDDNREEEAQIEDDDHDPNGPTTSEEAERKSRQKSRPSTSGESSSNKRQERRPSEESRPPKRPAVNPKTNASSKSPAPRKRRQVPQSVESAIPRITRSRANSQMPSRAQSPSAAPGSRGRSDGRRANGTSRATSTSRNGDRSSSLPRATPPIPIPHPRSGHTSPDAPAVAVPQPTAARPRGRPPISQSATSRHTSRSASQIAAPPASTTPSTSAEKKPRKTQRPNRDYVKKKGSRRKLEHVKGEYKKIIEKRAEKKKNQSTSS